MQALLSDAYGNLLGINGTNVSLSIFVAGSFESFPEWLLATQLSVLGKVSFRGLRFSKTLASCNDISCIRPKFALSFTSLSCVLPFPCLAVQSMSNTFLMNAANASNLTLLSSQAKLGPMSSFEEIQLQIQDIFGNVVIVKNTCWKVCVIGLGQTPPKLTIWNSNNSCIDPQNGSVYFDISMDKQNATIQFSCRSSGSPSVPFALFTIYNFQPETLKAILVTFQPNSSRVGVVFSVQPVIQLCSSQIGAGLPTCSLLNASGTVFVDTSVPGASGLSGSLSAPIIQGIGAFTDLKVMHSWLQ